MPKKIEASLDEVMEKRKDFSDGEGGLYKAIAQPASYNDAERSAVFVMSAETEDRYGDVVIQSGIDLEPFQKNPVALFGHRSWDMPIGNWSDIRMVRSSPKRTEGKMTFTDEGIDDIADRTARHVKAGTLRACSIGFRAKRVERIYDDQDNWTLGYKFNEIELFECSVVTIPAVREALIKGKGQKIEDIVDPTVVEEFLEHLKKNPAVARLVDKDLYEDVLREIGGNKTVSVGTVGVKIDGLDELRGIADRMEKAAERFAAAESATGETGVPQVDPLEKEAVDALESALKGIEPKIEEIPETEERRGVLSGFVERVRSAFRAPEQEKPTLASQEAKDALKKRLDEIQARHAA